MRNLVAWLTIIVAGSFALSPLYAQAQTAEGAAPGAQGVDSAWDHESVDVLTGNVHLEIPLYTAHSADMFGWSVALSYDSKVWDSSDLNYNGQTGQSWRHLTGFGLAGYGWTINLGRVYSEKYTSGTSETYYYFQGLSGDTHRLFRKASGSPCQAEPFWYAFDGSGIRAQSNPSDPTTSPLSTVWTVWYPNGNTLTLAHYQSTDPNLRFPNADFNGWYTTTITSSQPKSNNTSRYSVTINYYSDLSGMSNCPLSIVDNDNPSRTVNFTCNYVSFGAGQGYSGGLISSIVVPAPSSTTPTQTYQFQYTLDTLLDPFVCTEADPLGCRSYTGINFLSSVTATGVSPPYAFQFVYTVKSKNFGELQHVILPGGAQRDYQYQVQNIWRKDYPIIFNDPRLNPQFGYFAILGVSSRNISVDGKSWFWEYERDNDPKCSPSGDGITSGPDFCHNYPETVSVWGPYDASDPTITKNITVYQYNGTRESVGTPSPKDGTINTIHSFAGSGIASVPVRTTTYEYEYDVPGPPGCMVIGAFDKAHYADNLRVTKVSTSYDDDGNSPHDLKVIDYNAWAKVAASVPNFGRNQEIVEEKPDPAHPGQTVPFRRTEFAFTLTTGQVAAWVLTPTTWVRTDNGNPVGVRSESDSTFDDYGRMTLERKLCFPTSSPQAVSQDDLLSTFTYDSATGNQSSVGKQIPHQGTNLGETTLSWSGGYPTKRQIIGLASAWYSLDVDREANWGLPIEVRQANGTGVSITYDSIGRQTAIGPLANSPGAPVAITYETNQSYGTYQLTKVIGNAADATSIQTRTILDGLGRVKEEQVLKTDDQGMPQWVSKQYTRDVLGNVVTESNWAPVGITRPVTTTSRSGTYGGTTNVYGDPFLRVRKTVAPDGATTFKTYQGLVTTTTIQGVQGGSASQPTPINSVTTETFDVFGRLVNATTTSEGAAAADRVVDYTYDELDQRTKTKTWDLRVPGAPVSQTQYTFYDYLGRVSEKAQPERGRIWFGSLIGGSVIEPDGYDALGNVIRFEDEPGYAASPHYHYRLTYDTGGRLTMVEKEAETTGARTRISEYAYDDVAHGLPSGQMLDKQSQYGQLTTVKSYDDNGTTDPPVAQTDYYYQEPSGRFTQMATTFGAWGTATPYKIYYDYDNLGQVSTISYPTTQSAPVSCSGLTCLSMTRQHGLINKVTSTRGYDMVSSALYNDAGVLKQWVAGSGVKTQVVQDPNVLARPQEIKVLNAGGGTLWTTGTYSYDGAGSIKTIGTGPDVFTYDSVGRLKESQVTGTSLGTWYKDVYTYDPFDNILSKVETFYDTGSTTSTTTYNIDPATNRIRGLGTATNWVYDNDGALTQDDTLSYVYDNGRRLSQVKVGATEQGKYSYDAFGLRVYRKEDHGKEVFYFRGPDGNVLSQFSRPVDVTTIAPQWDRDYVYFGNDRISMIEEPAPSAVAWKTSSATGTQISLQWYSSTETDTYGYLVYRKAATQSAFTPLYAGTSAITTSGTSYVDAVTSGTTYTYKIDVIDNNGNVGADSVERLIIAGDATPTAAPTNLAATAGSHTVALSWTAPANPYGDLAGYYIYRRTSGSYGSPLNTYPIMQTVYTDNGLNNGTLYYYRVRAVDTAGLLSGFSNEVNATPSGLQGALDKGWLRLGGEELVERQGHPTDDESGCAPYESVGQTSGANVFFLHSDHLGSLRLVTNTQGAIATNHKYLPYGEEIQPMRTLNPYRFAGYERDSESQKDYVRARYYSPGHGRWQTPDPLGDGFKYVADRPTMRNDPTGLGCWLHTRCNWVDTDGGGRLVCYQYEYCDAGGLPETGGGGGGGSGGGGGGAGGEGTAPVPDNPPHATKCAHGIGVGVQAGATAALGSYWGAGGIVTGQLGAGLFASPSGLSSGGYTSGAIAGRWGNSTGGFPAQSLVAPRVAGGYIGYGPGAFITNAGSPGQLAGPFAVLNIDIGFGEGKGSLQIAADKNGTWIVSFNGGIAPYAAGIGGDISFFTSNTETAGTGCTP